MKIMNCTICNPVPTMNFVNCRLHDVGDYENSVWKPDITPRYVPSLCKIWAASTMLSDPKKDDKSRVARNNSDGPSATLNSIFLALKSQRDTIPNSLITFLLGSTTAISSVLVYKRYGKRIKNSDWITPKHLAKKRWIKGVVTRCCLAGFSFSSQDLTDPAA